MLHVPCSFALPVSKPFPISVRRAPESKVIPSGLLLRPYLEKHVSVRSVYAITGFTLQPPRPSYRACRFRHWLALGPATKYELLPPDVGAAFKPESYEFVPFAQFPGRLPPCPYLTELFVLFYSNGLEIEVSLWYELSNVLDADNIPLDDMSAPVIVAFLSFQIRPYMGKTTASSGLASRVLPAPLHPSAESLRAQYITTSSFFSHPFSLSVHPLYPSSVYPVPVLHPKNARIMSISASELALAYPDVGGPLPHALQMMIGQKVVFGVHLPRHVHASTYKDFRISKIWGLNLPRAQLRAQLPALQLPYRTPSPDIPAVATAIRKKKATSVLPTTSSKSSPAKNKSTVPAPPPNTPAQRRSRVVSSAACASENGRKKARDHRYQLVPEKRLLLVVGDETAIEAGTRKQGAPLLTDSFAAAGRFRIREATN
ncbi:hypothetical protein LINGRAHAP2_LOCUS25074 [Linum grandiflorum]